MNQTYKNIMRAALLPIKLEYFTKKTREDFINLLIKLKFIKQPDAAMADQYLKSAAGRSALYDMLKREQECEYQYPEDEILLQKDIDLIKPCCDDPIASIGDNGSWRSFYFFEDLTLLISTAGEEHHPEFYLNFYSYIYKNLDYMSYLVWDNVYDNEVNKTLKSLGISFDLQDNGWNIYYTEEFKNGLFADDFFKPMDTASSEPQASSIL